MLANRAHAPDALESRALRSAFAWSAVMVALVALVLSSARMQATSSGRDNLGASSQDAAAHTAAEVGVGTASSEGSATAIREVVYRQRKPLGSIFPAPVRVTP